MIINILNKFFNKKTISKTPLTIINKNRERSVVRQRAIYQKKERQETCLSKYFANIKGLNSTERNIYYEFTF